MSQSKPDGVNRDTRSVSGESDKHSARIEGLYPGIFPSSEYPTTLHEMRIKKHRRSSTEVGDLSIYIDLIAKDLDKDENLIEAFMSVLGLHPKDNDFEVFSVTEKVLRALSEAFFKNLAELKINEELVYEHPETEYDLKKVLEDIGELRLKGKKIDSANARVIEGTSREAEAFVTVNRSHSSFTHDIRIDIRGNIEKEHLKRIVNYLEENLEIERLFEKDNFLFN
ncbi:MAG: hypothetical protein R6V01_09755 [Thermoplasmatota archaeon]